MKWIRLQQRNATLLYNIKEELDLLDYLIEWARIKYASEAFAPVKLNSSTMLRKYLTPK
jgi:two-component system CheB/CheR fusion protein